MGLLVFGAFPAFSPLPRIYLLTEISTYPPFCRMTTTSIPLAVDADGLVLGSTVMRAGFVPGELGPMIGRGTTGAGLSVAGSPRIT